MPNEEYSHCFEGCHALWSLKVQFQTVIWNAFNNYFNLMAGPKVFFSSFACNRTNHLSGLRPGGAAQGLVGHIKTFLSALWLANVTSGFRLYHCLLVWHVYNKALVVFFHFRFITLFPKRQQTHLWKKDQKDEKKTRKALNICFFVVVGFFFSFKDFSFDKSDRGTVSVKWQGITKDNNEGKKNRIQNEEHWSKKNNKETKTK